MNNFEYGVIGGGPAGYTAAMYLAKKGYSVILFEKDKIGGTCLNKGCIPTKSFLHISELYANTLKASESGIYADNISLNFAKAIEKKDINIEKIRKNLELAIKNSGVTTVYAEAFVNENNKIIANDTEYFVDKIILATGAVPREIKGLECDGKFLLNSEHILNIKELPNSILIVGSGAIGIEWARIFSNFNVDVTLVETAPHLLPLADIEISKRIERIFKKNNIKFFVNDCIQKIENKNITLKSGYQITPELVLIAAGRTPVCPQCEADIILGDACGEIQLAHYAIHQAKQYALGIEYNKDLVPSVIYGNPEVAWVGKREQDCMDGCKKVILPITALGKSWCDDATEGVIKLIVENNEIVGAHIVSKEASSLIHIVLMAIQNHIKTSDIAKMSFAHPTYAEGIFDMIINSSCSET